MARTAGKQQRTKICEQRKIKALGGKNPGLFPFVLQTLQPRKLADSPISMALLYSLKLILSRLRKKYKRKLANWCIKPVCSRGGTSAEAKVFEQVKHDKRGKSR